MNVDAAIQSAVEAVKTAKEEPVLTVVPRPPPPTPIMDDAQMQWGEVVATMRDMAGYYGYTGELPENVLAALPCPEGMTPSAHAKRVIQKFHIHLLHLWGKGEIPGPSTADNLEVRARRYEEAAKNMAKMKNVKAAEKMAAKAAETRAIKPTPRNGKAWW